MFNVFLASLRHPFVLLLAVLVALALGATSLGDRLDLSLSDWRLRHFSAGSASPPITIVAIDEAALDLLGPWPWPRSVMAKLLDQLFTRYEPAVVGLDMVFPPGGPEREDAALAQAMAGRPVVAGQLFTEETGERGAPRYQLFDHVTDWPRFHGVLANSPQLGPLQAGHINALMDTDGKMRRIWPGACAPQGCSPALSVQLFGVLTATRNWHLEAGGLWQSRWRFVPEGLKELALPLDEHQTAVIPWRAEPPHRYISAARVWRGELPPESLKNHVVLIGATAHGLGDRVNTPVGPYIPGVETHARVLGAWLDGQIPWIPVCSNMLLLALGLLQTGLLLWVRQRSRELLAVGLSLSLSALVANIWLYRTFAIQMPLVEPVLFPLVFTVGLMLTALYADRSWIMSQIGSYLPAPLVRHLREHTPDPGEEMSWTTVMYADVIGSTTASRHMEAIDLAHWSNRAVDLVAHEITLRDGIIDNIAGDGLMVYWRDGSPAEQARCALEAALAIRRGLEQLNAEQQVDWPPLRMGVGIHAGLLLAGNFGQARRRYTILGEVANLAFRIERQTRKLPALQLMSAAVAEQAHGIVLQALAEVVLEGSDEPVKLFAFPEN